MYIRLRYFILGALVLAAHWLMTDATEAQAQNREPQTLTEIVSEVGRAGLRLHARRRGNPRRFRLRIFEITDKAARNGGNGI
ncbi:TPA: hypothetical protein ACLAV6_000083 [Neisseria meningitidis]